MGTDRQEDNKRSIETALEAAAQKLNESSRQGRPERISVDEALRGLAEEPEVIRETAQAPEPEETSAADPAAQDTRSEAGQEEPGGSAPASAPDETENVDAVFGRGDFEVPVPEEQETPAALSFGEMEAQALFGGTQEDSPDGWKGNVPVSEEPSDGRGESRSAQEDSAPKQPGTAPEPPGEEREETPGFKDVTAEIDAAQIADAAGEMSSGEEDDVEIEMESDEEAEEADEENETALQESDADEELDYDADVAAQLRIREQEDAAAERAAMPVPQRAMAEAADLGKGVSGLWRRFTSWLGRCRKTWLSWRKWQQVLSAVLAALLLVVGLAYAYFHSKYILMDISDGVYSSEKDLEERIASEDDDDTNENLESRLESGELEETEAVEATGDIFEDEEIFNILLIGTDDRTTEFSDNARGDTCILLSINRATGKINLVSFERATGVKVPSGDYEGQWDWLTHMFWYGGPDMMMEVIRENFKVDVTKYVRVNIRTFMKLVDAVGGVDIDMTEAEVDNINHPEGTYTADHITALGVEDEVQQDLVVGVNHLNGATAMLYARLRSIDDDWHRVVRQRNVILAAVENLKTLSLTELDNLLNEVLPLVQTNLTEADVASLLADAPLFLEMDYGSITFPLDNTYGLMDGMSGRRVLAVDFDTNAQELQNLLNGEISAEELADKYENLEDELEDYSYKDSETYQANYADAESIAGKSTYSSSSSSSSASSDSAAEAAVSSGSVDGADTADTSSAQAVTITGLGTVESVVIDETAGTVTTTYYNETTGERTVIVTGSSSGASVSTESAQTDESTSDTAQTGTTDSLTVESAGYDPDTGTAAQTTETTASTTAATTDTTAETTLEGYYDTGQTTEESVSTAEDSSTEILTGNAAAEAYAAAEAAAAAAAAAASAAGE